MKHTALLKIASAAVLLTAATACADLGFGVDVEDDVPYYSGGIGINPGWTYNYGPDWDMGWGVVPAAPPVVGNGPGSVIPSQPPRPIRPIRPINPGNGGYPGGVGPVINGGNGGAARPNGIPAASSRPGNMGRY